jgi:hypothetical protein
MQGQLAPRKKTLHPSPTRFGSHGGGFHQRAIGSLTHQYGRNDRGLHHDTSSLKGAGQYPRPKKIEQARYRGVDDRNASQRFCLGLGGSTIQRSTSGDSPRWDQMSAQAGTDLGGKKRRAGFSGLLWNQLHRALLQGRAGWNHQHVTMKWQQRLSKSHIHTHILNSRGTRE